MGNCLCLTFSASPEPHVSKKSKDAPINTAFKLPTSLPSWPAGDGFGSGVIDLGGLQVCQISTLNKVWATNEGGPDNLGASFFEPSQSQMPPGFFMLGCYAQPNNRLLYGWVLSAKDETTTSTSSAVLLEKPIDYTLVWSSESLKIKQDGIGCVWLPTPPDGYKAVGYVVTNSTQKPSIEKVRCVRADLTDQCETDSWIWGPTAESSSALIYSLRPTNRNTQARGVSVGTFGVQTAANIPPELACLKNVRFNLSSCMPNKAQIQAVFQAYSPWIYLHPDEDYLPSSVNWYFANGALLYKKGEESNPVPVEANGSNLPQGGSDDGAYWLDLPVDGGAKERVKKGDLQDAEVYLHVKPMLGATFTDIAIWVFYPFNGAAKAKVEFINISLGVIGEHVGDWEHVTLRVSNFSGELWSVYLSEHSKGAWFNASELEYQNGNKPVTYSSLHGHAMYSKPGLVLQGTGGIGIRNDTAKSNKVMDTGSRFSVVSAEYLGAAANDIIIEPPWLNYFRKWGPKISYVLADELKKVEKGLPGPLKSAFEKLVKSLPNEVLGEEGPAGPKLKSSWTGDEAT